VKYMPLKKAISCQPSEALVVLGRPGSWLARQLHVYPSHQGSKRWVLQTTSQEKLVMLSGQLQLICNETLIRSPSRYEFKHYFELIWDLE